MKLLTLIALGSIFLSCAILILHRKYEDGIIGRAAIGWLSIMVLAAGSQLYECGQVSESVQQWTAIAVATFLLRHVYRFLRWSRKGVGDWSAPITKPLTQPLTKQAPQ